MAQLREKPNLMRIVIDYDETIDLLHALAAVKSAVMNGRNEVGINEIGYKLQYSMDKKEMPYFTEREVVLSEKSVREVTSRVEISGNNVIHYYPSAMNSVQENH